MLIEIASLRNLSQSLDTVDILCDRSYLLGNPFDLRHEKDRDKVCDAFDEWLETNLRYYDGGLNKVVPLDKWIEEGMIIAATFKNPKPQAVYKKLEEILSYLIQGKKVRLLCWCHPKRCHTLSIKRVLESMMEKAVTRKPQP
jgi:hypothetical protein